MKKSTIILFVGLFILLVGAVLSLLHFEPYADYVLIAGAVVVVIRGFVRTHERDDNTNPPSDAG